MPTTDLRDNPMMQHLMDALDRGEDIGHYGRLVFTMTARHFLSDDELCDYLCKDPSFDELQARALLKQVQARGYNPPSARRISQWQQEQEFPICPNTGNPGDCNVTRI